MIFFLICIQFKVYFLCFIMCCCFFYETEESKKEKKSLHLGLTFIMKTMNSRDVSRVLLFLKLRNYLYSVTICFGKISIDLCCSNTDLFPLLSSNIMSVEFVTFSLLVNLKWYEHQLTHMCIRLCSSKKKIN